MEKLANTIEHTEKRGKVLEAKVNNLKMEALQKRKNKDNRGMNSDKMFFRCTSCNEVNENVRKGTSTD